MHLRIALCKRGGRVPGLECDQFVEYAQDLDLRGVARVDRCVEQGRFAAALQQYHCTVIQRLGDAQPVAQLLGQQRLRAGQRTVFPIDPCLQERTGVTVIALCLGVTLERIGGSTQQHDGVRPLANGVAHAVHRSGLGLGVFDERGDSGVGLGDLVQGDRTDRDNHERRQGKACRDD